jgi:SPP1 gp7 family putative phage head morphogenesis protein
VNKVLQPIHHRDAYSLLVEREILAWMREAIFTPLVDVLDRHGIGAERINEAGIAIEHALNSGQIHYADGAFSGKFTSATSRELQQMGARWEASTKRWLIPVDKIPYAIRGAIATSAAIGKAAADEIIATLTAIEANVAAADLGLKLGQALDVILKDLGKQYLRTVTAIESVSIKADVTPAQRALLDTRLTNNLDLSIKRFASEQIPELRRAVEQNLFYGNRTDKLADLIESRYGVSKRKAAFLAEQETGMLTAKYAQIQAEEIGSTEYVWSTSRDERVRPDHQALDGKRFSYSSPPITNRATGARNNPGEDFRCRCVAMPVIKFPSA